MLSPYKLKWAFVFCNFSEAKDRSNFKKKMKSRGYSCGYLNAYNVLITCSQIEYNTIMDLQPENSNFQTLFVTDKQFSKMTNVFKRSKKNV